MNWSLFAHGSTSSSLVRDVTFPLRIRKGQRHGCNARYSSRQGIWGDEMERTSDEYIERE